MTDENASTSIRGDMPNDTEGEGLPNQDVTLAKSGGSAGGENFSPLNHSTSRKNFLAAAGTLAAGGLAVVTELMNRNKSSAPSPTKTPAHRPTTEPQPPVSIFAPGVNFPRDTPQPVATEARNNPILKKPYIFSNPS